MRFCNPGCISSKPTCFTWSSQSTCLYLATVIETAHPVTILGLLPPSPASAPSCPGITWCPPDYLRTAGQGERSPPSSVFPLLMVILQPSAIWVLLLPGQRSGPQMCLPAVHSQKYNPLFHVSLVPMTTIYYFHFPQCYANM